MKLYHLPKTRSSRVRWLLGELQVAHDVEHVNIFAGEGRKPEYLKVHPHGFVPALEDDGGVLIESIAICMHLVDGHGGGELAPAPGTRERGKYYEWMVYVAATADPACEAVVFHTMFLPENKRIPQVAERAKKTWATKIEPRYREALARSPWILGESFSAADVAVGSSLAWAKFAGMLGDDPVIERYLAAVEQRPAFRAAYDD